MPSFFLCAIIIFGTVSTLGLTEAAAETSASDSGYSAGEIVEFGSYPQTRVTDMSTLSALNMLSVPWESYG